MSGSSCGHTKAVSGAPFCPDCGAQLIVEEQRRICLRCASSISGSSLFCPFCRTGSSDLSPGLPIPWALQLRNAFAEVPGFAIETLWRTGVVHGLFVGDKTRELYSTLRDFFGDPEAVDDPWIFITEVPSSTSRPGDPKSLRLEGNGKQMQDSPFKKRIFMCARRTGFCLNRPGSPEQFELKYANISKWVASGRGFGIRFASGEELLLEARPLVSGWSKFLFVTQQVTAIGGVLATDFQVERNAYVYSADRSAATHAEKRASNAAFGDLFSAFCNMLASVDQRGVCGPGWYPDPSKKFQHRYWDGGGWTTRVATQGTESADRTTDVTDYWGGMTLPAAAERAS